MATNGNIMSVSQPTLPICKGEHYEFWSIKMKTLFQSQDMLYLVLNGFQDCDEEVRLKENKKKVSKALFFIQQAIHESIFSRIATTSTFKQAWTTVKNEFQGSSKVIVVKLQTLRKEFETMNMKLNEAMQEYISRMMAVVYQMRAFNDNISNQKVIKKVLRIISPHFDHIVIAIEESKDLSQLTIDELSGSLRAHEACLNRFADKTAEKVFSAKMEAYSSRPMENMPRRDRGRGVYKARSNGRRLERALNNDSSTLNNEVIEAIFSVSIAKNMGMLNLIAGTRVK